MAVAIVQANYEDLAQIAARWHQQHETSEALDRRLKAALQPLEQGGWIGLGAAAFFSEMRGEVLPAIARLSAALEIAQSVTLEIREQMRQAEEDAANPFKTKGEHGPDAGSGGGGGKGDGGGGGGGGGGDGKGGGGGGLPPLPFNMSPGFANFIKTLDGFKVLDSVESGLKLVKAWSEIQSATGSGGLKKVADLLVNTKAAGILTKVTSVVGVFGDIVGFAAELTDNWERFRGSDNALAKIAVGTVVDFALSKGINKGGQLIGGGIGLFLGGPMGAVVGGFVGGIAADFIAKQIDNKFHYKEAIDKGVDHVVDWSVNKAKDVGQQIAKNTSNFVQQQARNVEDGLRNVGNAIGNFCKPRFALFGG